jgi:hypothetical protein
MKKLALALLFCSTAHAQVSSTLILLLDRDIGPLAKVLASFGIKEASNQNGVIQTLKLGLSALNKAKGGVLPVTREALDAALENPKLVAILTKDTKTLSKAEFSQLVSEVSSKALERTGPLNFFVRPGCAKGEIENVLALKYILHEANSPVAQILAQAPRTIPELQRDVGKLSLRISRADKLSDDLIEVTDKLNDGEIWQLYIALRMVADTGDAAGKRLGTAIRQFFAVNGKTSYGEQRLWLALSEIDPAQMSTLSEVLESISAKFPRDLAARKKALEEFFAGQAADNATLAEKLAYLRANDCYGLFRK